MIDYEVESDIIRDGLGQVVAVHIGVYRVETTYTNTVEGQVETTTRTRVQGFTYAPGKEQS